MNSLDHSTQLYRKLEKKTEIILRRVMNDFFPIAQGPYFSYQSLIFMTMAMERKKYKCRVTLINIERLSARIVFDYYSVIRLFFFYSVIQLIVKRNKGSKSLKISFHLKSEDHNSLSTIVTLVKEIHAPDMFSTDA